MNEHRARRDLVSRVPKQYISLHAIQTLLEIQRIWNLADYDPPVLYLRQEKAALGRVADPIEWEIKVF